MNNPFSFLDGYKTYVAAAGLAGLALYQFSSGDYSTAWTSLMGALAAVGIKHAVTRNEVKPEDKGPEVK